MADNTLTELQRAVLELFFTLPESEWFVLAGGAGLSQLRDIIDLWRTQLTDAGR